jgi:hypothetical protein
MEAAGEIGGGIVFSNDLGRNEFSRMWEVTLLI